MKKSILLLLSLLLVLVGISTVTAEIEISFWNGFTGSDGVILTEIVNDFNETNDKGIKIKMDIIPWANFFEKLPPALATNTAPEMILMGMDQIAPYSSMGNLVDISDFFDTMSVDRSNFSETVLDLCTYNGVLYMAPMQTNSLYLYWNKDLFIEAGLDPESPPETWDELYEMAIKLTNPEKNVYGFGLPVGSISVYYNHLLAEGGNLIDSEGKASLNSEPALKVFTMMQNAIMNDKVSPMATTGPDFDNLLFAGQLALYVNGPWCINGCNTHNLNYGITKLPKGSAGYANGLEGCGFAVTKNISEEEKMAAFEFMKFWNSTETCKKWSLINGFPPYLKSVQEDAEVKNNQTLVVMAEALDYGVPYLWGQLNLTPINNDVLFPMMERIMNGADVAEELAAANEALSMLLN